MWLDGGVVFQKQKIVLGNVDNSHSHSFPLKMLEQNRRQNLNQNANKKTLKMGVLRRGVHTKKVAGQPPNQKKNQHTKAVMHAIPWTEPQKDEGGEAGHGPHGDGDDEHHGQVAVRLPFGPVCSPVTKPLAQELTQSGWVVVLGVAGWFSAVIVR